MYLIGSLITYSIFYGIKGVRIRTREPDMNSVRCTPVIY